MELLCIESSYGDPGAICVHEGCRYTLERVVTRKVHPNGKIGYIWYILLETGRWEHHSSLFVVAPPVTEETIELEQKISEPCLEPQIPMKSV